MFLGYKKREELLQELEIANMRIVELEKQIVDLCAEKDVHKIKNERNAGRKHKFSDSEVTSIQMMKLRGMSYRAIAKEFNCSVGLVHKLLNEPLVGN